MTGLVIDSFAGGGGASTGIEWALGRPVDIAINHDEDAIGLHAANHPCTEHLASNIWKVDPAVHCAGREVALLWASPDCRHHSKAKGGRPLERDVRDLAWVVVRWAHQVRPRIIALENVEEFADWGPLLADGRPCPARRGEIFGQFVAALKRLGYKVAWRELRACDYGAPTIRKRLFLIARRDGQPIRWPEPTHGPPDDPKVLAGLLKPWRTAAEIIDWAAPCPSIFDSREEIFAKYGLRAVRPLKIATLRRVARGVIRYVIEAADPFIVPITHRGDDRVHSIRDPLRTVTTASRGEMALAVPHLATMRNAEKPFNEVDRPTHTITAGGARLGLVSALVSRQFGQSIGHAASDPSATVTAGGGGKSALVAAFLAQHNTGLTGHDARKPLSTIVNKGCTQALVAAHMLSLKGSDRRDAPMEAPVATVCAGGGHAALVGAFLQKYYGTAVGQKADDPLAAVTTRDRFGLVTVAIAGESYVLDDIGMRMLSPRELFRAQGFPDDYVIDCRADGKALTKTASIRMAGNSVCPQVAAAVVAANLSAGRAAEPLAEEEAAA